MSSPHEALGIGERIAEAMAIEEVFTIHAFGLTIPITDTVITTWVVMAILIVFSLFVTRRLKEIPRGAQALMESVVEFANNFTGEYIGHHGRKYVPYIGTIALFLLVANLLPLITPIGGFGFEPILSIKPLARDINVTAAMAIMTMCVVVYSTFRYRGGPLGFAKKLFEPMPMMLPFNIIEYVVKPLSLTLRLFGNILAAFIIMQLIEIIMPVGLPPIMALYFDLFDGLIQAVVFSFLSTVYIAEAIE